MKTIKETVQIKDLAGYTKNPRKINKQDLEVLKKSLEDFPEMLDIRSVVIDEDNQILGGHMRVKALEENGETEINVLRVVGLSEEQKNEFVIKDNTQSGTWDNEVLKNDWDGDKLKEGGGSEFRKVLPGEQCINDMRKCDETIRTTIETSTDYDKRLFFREKYNIDKLDQINTLNCPEELKDVMRCRVGQCCDINFDQIAKFYRSDDCDEETADMLKHLYLVFITSGEAFEEGIIDIDTVFGKIFDGDKNDK